MMKQTRRHGKQPPRIPGQPERKDSLIPCTRASEWEPLLYDYAEGLCDGETRAAVRGHLTSCAYCSSALEDIRWMMTALQESAPEPPAGLHTRVMDAVRAEDAGCGRIITETVDVRTGRVLDEPRFSLSRMTRMIGGIAAAVVVVIGLMMLLPLMRRTGASTTPEILGELQEGDRGTFSDGVFIGTESEQPQETEANGFGVIPGVREPIETAAEIVHRYPVVITVDGAEKQQILSLLSGLMTSDGTVAVLTEADDGILVSPLSVYEAAVDRLEAADLAADVSVRNGSSEDDTQQDAFYIQIREP